MVKIEDFVKPYEDDLKKLFELGDIISE